MKGYRINFVVSFGLIPQNCINVIFFQIDSEAPDRISNDTASPVFLAHMLLLYRLLIKIEKESRLKKGKAYRLPSRFSLSFSW